MLATSLIGCGSDSDDSPTVGTDPETPIVDPDLITPTLPVIPTTPDDDSVLIAECENSGCTLDEAVSTPTLTVTTAAITLTENASITLE